MKFEIPPEIQMSDQLIEDYFKKKFENFIKVNDLRYFYWDELKFKKNLPYNDPEKAWSLIKLHRRGNYKRLLFSKITFNYSLTESIQKNLHEFDLKLIGGLYKQPITPYDKAEYLKNSVLVRSNCKFSS